MPHRNEVELVGVEWIRDNDVLVGFVIDKSL